MIKPVGLLTQHLGDQPLFLLRIVAGIADLHMQFGPFGAAINTAQHVREDVLRQRGTSTPIKSVRTEASARALRLRM